MAFFGSAKDSTRVEHGPDDRSVRSLQHLQAPFAGEPDESPLIVAKRYRDEVAATLYRLPQLSEPRELEWLSADHAAGGGRGTVPVTVVGARQTVMLAEDVPVFLAGCGLRIVMRQSREDRSRYLVTSSSSTVRPFSEAAADYSSLEGLTKCSLRSLARRQLERLDYAVASEQISARLVIPQAKVSPQLQVDAVLFTDASHTATAGYRFTWENPRADGEGLRLISIIPHVSNCFGSVFLRDPVSRFGNPRIFTDVADPALEPMSETVSFTNLNAPAPDLELAGSLVELFGTNGTQNPLGFQPPKGVTGGFDAPVRTNRFAAANAYYHCNCAFQMASDFNCNSSTYFHPKQFPVPVAHRGPIVISPPSPGADTDAAPYVDSQVFTVNAQVFQDLGEDEEGHELTNRVREIRFALAGMQDSKHSPLGAATDRRIMWHEFGHALLVAGTQELELPFAHSIGDSLSAILSDPDSEMARPVWNTGLYSMRGLTFPFVQDALRRHDRAAEEGWAWNGTLLDPGVTRDDLDPDGYLGEEILSSTLFRLYRAIGGDTVAPDGEPARHHRQRAAAYIAYLTVWAIKLLGPAQTSPSTPTILATALSEVDAATGVFDVQIYPPTIFSPRRGGALRKVVRWAFEQQGLYWPPAASRPWNRPGEPEQVDIFIDDGRGGTYEFTDSWEAAPAAIQVIPAGSATPGPVSDALNHVFVTVANRGTGPASGIVVRIWATSSSPDVWNNTGDWQLLTISGAQESSPAGPVASGGSTVIGPFEWVPVSGARQALIVVATAPGDASLLDSPSSLACAQGPTPVVDLVPFDNNLGYQVWLLP